MIVRSAREADLAAVVGLLGELHNPPTAIGDAGVWRAMLEQSRRTVLVADDEGAVVGVVDLIVVPNLTHEARPWAIIENVAVAPKRRREGIATRIFEEAERLAIEAGCYKIQLISRGFRGAAHHFYESAGFEASAEGFRRYLE